MNTEDILRPFLRPRLKRSLFLSGTLMAGAAVLSTLLALLLRRFFGPLSPGLSAVLQATGAGILLWATVWELGWDIRSFGGQTLAERAHQWLFRTLCVTGTFAFLLAYVWSGL